MKKIKLAIFASGSGTNAVNIIHYFKEHHQIEVSLVCSNKLSAPVLEKARKLGVETLFFHPKEMKSLSFTDKLQGADFIVLAGFMILVPNRVVNSFPDKILNIHPALLPKYGGKGMYGHHVHEAVIAAGEKESGITIHKVNNKYDEGEVVHQAKCIVEEKDDADSLAQKIHQLEYDNYPKVIENYVLNFNS